MATPQTSYQRDFNLPNAGSPFDSDDIRATARVNGSGSALTFGIAVKEGATAGQFLPLSAASDAVAGILLNSFAHDPNFLNGVQAGIGANMLERGSIWVACEQDVAVTDPVYVRHTSDGGSNTQPGTFRKDADSGRAVRLAGARWVQAGSAGGSAAVYFDRGAPLGGSATQITYDQASVSATTTKKILGNRADRYFVVDAVQYDNATGLAADAANYFVIQVKNGTSVAAQWSTQTSADGALAADTFVTLNLTAANLILAPGAVMSMQMTLNGTQTLPAGRLVVHGRYL